MPDKKDDLAIVKGIPLEDQPGLGALTFPELLRDVTSRFAAREALVMHHQDGAVERWSYHQLWERSVEVARSLIALGAGKDSRIGILMTNRPEWVASCLGIMLAGGTAVGLSTFSTPAELEYLLETSAVSILLFERRILKKDFLEILSELEPQITNAPVGTLASTRFPYLRRLVMVGDGEISGAVEAWPAFIARGEGVPAALVKARSDMVKPSDPALLLFSSGSTGRPKGILNSHRGISIQAWRYPYLYEFEDAHPVRTWSANGLFWSGNFALAIGGTFTGGGSLVLQPTFVPKESIRLMQAERVTLPYCWPHQWAQLEAEPEWDNADLSGFYYCDVERNLRRPQKTITTTWTDPRASYGSTETFTISTSFPANTPIEVRGDSFGEALPGNTIKVVDQDTGKILKRGETGVFAVKGPTLMMGYIGVPNDEVLDDEGFYRSSDGGYIDERGRFVFQGRINDIIKTGGANVSPVEVDWELASCPGVKVCKTTGVPDDALGELVVSMIVREAQADLNSEDVVAYLKARLASYKVPRQVIFLTEDELDLTDTAKIKPKEARALAIRKLEAERSSA